MKRGDVTAKDILEGLAAALLYYAILVYLFTL